MSRKIVLQTKLLFLKGFVKYRICYMRTECHEYNGRGCYARKVKNFQNDLRVSGK